MKDGHCKKEEEYENLHAMEDKFHVHYGRPRFENED